MSGHYATLLRGTVETLLPKAEVYITDWTDARMVPVTEGRFDLDDYIDYVISKKPIEWFEDNVIMQVPWPQPGFTRSVYPGFLQLSGFMTMNLDRHMIAQKDFFLHLVKDDGDSAERHREFYDEYLAVMDMTAEFYLQTVDTVFIKHSLPKGEMMHRGRKVNTKAIRNVALLTVEGENDDISGFGQTEAAQTICSNIPDDMRHHYVRVAVPGRDRAADPRFHAHPCPRQRCQEGKAEADQGRPERLTPI